MNKHEIVLVGDIIRSRNKFDTKEWNSFLESIEIINSIYKDVLKVPMIVYSGDSFGAVCKDLQSAIKIVLTIQENLKRYKARMILIEGEITFGIEKKSFLILEGPALWETQNQFERLKKSNYAYFLAKTQNQITDMVLNTILNFILSIRQDWSEKEWQLYQNIDKNLNQKRIAKDLKVTQQYISKMLIKSKIREIYEAEKNLITIINGINN